MEGDDKGSEEVSTWYGRVPGEDSRKCPGKLGLSSVQSEAGWSEDMAEKCYQAQAE